MSRVKDMNRMFFGARSFNSDISKWDVSNVGSMKEMFRKATAFIKELCGPAWVRSKANKDAIFEGSPGSISTTVYTLTSVSHCSRR